MISSDEEIANRHSTDKQDFLSLLPTIVSRERNGHGPANVPPGHLSQNIFCIILGIATVLLSWPFPSLLCNVARRHRGCDGGRPPSSPVFPLVPLNLMANRSGDLVRLRGETRTVAGQRTEGSSPPLSIHAPKPRACSADGETQIQRPNAGSVFFLNRHHPFSTSRRIFSSACSRDAMSRRNTVPAGESPRWADISLSMHASSDSNRSQSQGCIDAPHAR